MKTFSKPNYKLPPKLVGLSLRLCGVCCFVLFYGVLSDVSHVATIVLSVVHVASFFFCTRLRFLSVWCECFVRCILSCLAHMLCAVCCAFCRMHAVLCVVCRVLYVCIACCARTDEHRTKQFTNHHTVVLSFRQYQRSRYQTHNRSLSLSLK